MVAHGPHLLRMQITRDYVAFSIVSQGMWIIVIYCLCLESHHKTHGIFTSGYGLVMLSKTLYAFEHSKSMKL